MLKLTEHGNGVTWLTLSRPDKRNALDGHTVVEWIDHLDALAKKNHLRLLVINGEGQDFCAGADLAWMQKMAQESDEVNQADAFLLASLFRKIDIMPCPVLTLVQGKVLGGGMGIVAASDMVIAADNTTFAFPEARMGLSPSVVSPYIIRLIGERAARYYFFTAESFSAERAFELGMVQQVVSDHALLKSAEVVIEKILKNSPHALRESKKLIQSVAKQTVSDELTHMTSTHLATMRLSPDAQEGINAFFAKRKPVWVEV
ncbi:MAG: enoyl-CoA hydratase-related protein [Gammaproteobacteria bacterium]|nr:enoyl-CoA hydratase-related protein [Gammaproteobacteria bacterium]